MRIKEFDRMRVFALVLVLLYHFFPSTFKGGFLAVEIFSVLSGFLMTAKAIDRFDGKHSLKFRDIALKQIGKLYLPLLLCLIFGLSLSFFFSPDFRVDIGRQSSAAAGMINNIYEIVSGGSYENQFIKHIFLQTWNLSLTVHFYLFWGFLVSLTSVRVSRKKAAGKNVDFRKSLLFLSLFFIFVSWILIAACIFKKAKISILYFSDPTRLPGFLYGAAAACVSGIADVHDSFKKFCGKTNRKTMLELGLAISGVFIVLSFVSSYSSILTYALYIPLTGILAAFMIFFMRAKSALMPKSSRIAVLSGKKFAGSGEISRFFSIQSYKIYLFHWPAFVLFESVMPPLSAALLSLLCTAFIILLMLTAKKFAALSKKNKTKCGKKGQGTRIFAFTLLFGLFFALQIPAELTAPPMLSLEKNIWEGNIGRDLSGIEKMAVTVKYKEEVFQKKLAAEEEKKRKEEIYQNNVKKIRTLVGDDWKAYEKLMRMLVDEEGIIIGDSTSIMPPGFLESRIPSIENDSEQDKSLLAGKEELSDLISSGKLPHFVIMALGNNFSWIEDERDIADEICELLPKGHRLLFVTPHDQTSERYQYYCEYLRTTIEEKYPFVTVIDWSLAAGQYEDLWSKSDGMHYYGINELMELRAKLILDGLKRSSEKPAK